MSGLPQFYPNTLELPELGEKYLRHSLHDLQAAALRGVNIIEAGDPPGQYDGRGIFTGGLGIALMYLRLAQQTPLFDGKRLPDFHGLAASRIPNKIPDFPLKVGRLSPLPSKSPIAAVVLRILHTPGTGDISGSDISCLNDAVDLALSHGPTGFYHGRELGADEVLFGRAGLLWSLLNIRARTGMSELRPVLARIPDLIRVIVQAGKDGAVEYAREHGDEGALPLMWKWMDGRYGIGWYVPDLLAGILPVLLACHPDELTHPINYSPDIAGTITALCTLCIAHNGHLPTTIPPRTSHRESPLVQICHGAPAILGLLGCALKSDIMTAHWSPEWDRAAVLATDRVWDEGLLSKGGGLCHGIGGNAWPLLMLHDAYAYHADALEKARQGYACRGQPVPKGPASEYFLSRALAMLLHARETRPYNTSAEPEVEYRLPDHPFSLFEGLAGTVCVWVDACAVLKARLRWMDVEDFGKDDVFKQSVQLQLGFPCLGGNGPMGFL